MGLGIINHRRKSQSTLKMLIVIIVLKMLILIPPKCHTDTCWMDFSGKVIFGLGLNNVLKHHQRKFSNQDMVSMYRYLRAIMLELSPNCQIGQVFNKIRKQLICALSWIPPIKIHRHLSQKEWSLLEDAKKWIANKWSPKIEFKVFKTFPINNLEISFSSKQRTFESITKQGKQTQFILRIQLD